MKLFVLILGASSKPHNVTDKPNSKGQQRNINQFLKKSLQVFHTNYGYKEVAEHHRAHDKYNTIGSPVSKIAVIFIH
jgi:hypothetical protein